MVKLFYSILLASTSGAKLFLDLFYAKVCGAAVINTGARLTFRTQKLQALCVFLFRESCSRGPPPSRRRARNRTPRGGLRVCLQKVFSSFQRETSFEEQLIADKPALVPLQLTCMEEECAHSHGEPDLPLTPTFFRQQHPELAAGPDYSAPRLGLGEEFSRSDFGQKENWLPDLAPVCIMRRQDYKQRISAINLITSKGEDFSQLSLAAV